jgi:hypothetical protein
MKLGIPKSWMVQAAPCAALEPFRHQIRIVLVGSVAVSSLPEEQIAMAEELVHSFLDDTTTKFLSAFESVCTNGIDLSYNENSKLMTMTGPAYDGIVKKATKLKRTHWKQHMVAVMNHHSSLIG